MLLSAPEHTDYFVDQLSTTYQSYGLQGLSEKKTTKDSKYSVTPMGRLIIVKIEDFVPDKEYESLRKDLERHYNIVGSTESISIKEERL